MDLNKATIIGRLTQDPEVKTTPNGQSVASFGVATNLTWKDQQGQKQERVEFHNVVAWRKLAEICGQYLQKGKQVYIEGRLQTRQWEGQDGVKRNRTEIVADNMIMLGGPGGSSGGGQSQPAASSAAEEPPVIQVEDEIKTDDKDNKPAAKGNNDKEKVSIEDIPF
ncbi:MAG: single-stranded DNA-binding protein [Parcubacteria group bacterium]